MVFGEIPLSGRSANKDPAGITTMHCSFAGNRAVDFALIEGSGSRVAAVRTSDDTPLTMTVQKFSHAGNKVTFHALAKHVELVFADAAPTIERVAFYGDIPDSDTTAKQTFSVQEVNAAAAKKSAAAAKGGAQTKAKGKGPATAKKPAAGTKTKAKPKTTVAVVKSPKPSVPPKPKASDPTKTKINFPKGTKRGTVTHIDTTKAPPPAIPPGALVINAPRVPPLREDDEPVEAAEGSADNTLANKKKPRRL